MNKKTTKFWKQALDLKLNWLLKEANRSTSHRIAPRKISRRNSCSSLHLNFEKMAMSAMVPPAKPARGRGPADGRAFFETLWRGGNFLLDRQKVLKRSRKRKLHYAAANNGGKRKQQQQLLQMQRQHCCCCQRIQLHLLAERRSNIRSVVRWIPLSASAFSSILKLYIGVFLSKSHLANVSTINV